MNAKTTKQILSLINKLDPNSEIFKQFFDLVMDTTEDPVTIATFAAFRGTGMPRKQILETILKG